jgi:hypothetical protein
MKKLAVLSRFKESNNFFENLISNQGYDIIIFNKYSGQNLLPNVGKEGHTYLHYIVENYYNLPDEILFSQYDPMDHFRGHKGSDRGQNIINFLNENLIDFCGIRPTDFDLIVRRKEINWIGFSKELFRKFDDQDVANLLACGSTLNGIFRVTKTAILKHDISLYKKALDMLSNGIDPYEGYFFERMWKFLFMDIGCKDETLKELEEKILLFGTKNSKNRKLNKEVLWKESCYGHIKLSKDGTIRSNGNISYYHNFNESFWLARNNTLFLLKATGAGSSIFELENSFTKFKNKEIQELNGKMSLGNNEWLENEHIFKNALWQDFNFKNINY